MGVGVPRYGGECKVLLLGSPACQRLRYFAADDGIAISLFRGFVTSTFHPALYKLS